MFNTPILFIVFNRPDTTQLVFNKIREQQPAKLYITSDGPRLNNETDKSNCEQVKAIVENIDWPCDVKRLYAKENLGFSRRIKSALQWFFENEEMGIILEDDCLPCSSFFTYCELLLEKHKDNDDVQLISGCNFCDQPISKSADYFIADFGYIWGWASWKRAFNNIKWQTDYDLTAIEKKLLSAFRNKEYVSHFYSIVEHYYNKKDCWDVELFVFTIMNNKKKILPNVNLVSNIGNSGTHYENSENKLLNTKTLNIDFKIFDVNNYTTLSNKEIKTVVDQFNMKVNPLTFRDKLYLLKIRLKEKLKNH